MARGECLASDPEIMPNSQLVGLGCVVGCPGLRFRACEQVSEERVGLTGLASLAPGRSVVGFEPALKNNGREKWAQGPSLLFSYLDLPVLAGVGQTGRQGRPSQDYVSFPQTRPHWFRGLDATSYAALPRRYDTAACHCCSTRYIEQRAASGTVSADPWAYQADVLRPTRDRLEGAQAGRSVIAGDERLTSCPRKASYLTLYFWYMCQREVRRKDDGPPNPGRMRIDHRANPTAHP
ncbi:hypothetical protein F4780DRAFT_668123 [Xylariomycetidae sp. FL0641]|nr:hypothetical protein F4780DRAFT_668123 [Xylariomycetidae sp. FL0641]